MIDFEQDEIDLNKVFGVTVINAEYFHVYAPDGSVESINEALMAGDYTPICTEDTQISSVHEIKG